jgi:hypothetical protein
MGASQVTTGGRSYAAAGDFQSRAANDREDFLGMVLQLGAQVVPARS